MDVRCFEHAAAGVNWYCEQRGDGPPVVLVPSGEGDCGSFDRVAALLADYFTVLTFDMPGFSRSSVQAPEDISAWRMGEQIAGLVESLGLRPAVFYGCSSGGFAVLDLLTHRPELVRHAVVHEVALGSAITPLLPLTELDDAAAMESCKFAFANVMNDDVAAWEALGEEFHARLARNYVTWVRRYLGAEVPPAPTVEELAGKPITWTVGALNPAGMFFENVVLAVKAGCSIGLLNSKHFPQVSAPDMLAEHIRVSVTS